MLLGGAEHFPQAFGFVTCLWLLLSFPLFYLWLLSAISVFEPL